MKNEDAAKLLTRRYAKEPKMDEFDRRQFRSLVLSAIEASVAEQSETSRAQKARQDEMSVFALKPRRGTNRACQARRLKQDE